MITQSRSKDFHSTFEVLLVEDNPGDVRLFLEEFKDHNQFLNIHVLNDGLEAYKYLLRKEDYVKAPKPDLLILDIYLPRKDGFEILNEINKNNELNEIPVVVYSSSMIGMDEIKHIENIHNMLYLRKPDDLKMYHEMVNKIEKFLYESRKN